MTDDARPEWLADLFVEAHGIEGAVDELQAVYEDCYNDRAERALAVLSAVRERKEVEA